MMFMAEALAAWADFPVSATPRPIVLTDGYVQIGPSGFMTGSAKLAFLAGAVDSRVELPNGVLALFTAHAYHQPASHRPRITITAVRPTEAPFRSDRGPRRFPAYAFDLDGTHEPVIVLDPATPVWWPKHPTLDPITRTTARIEVDGLTLHVSAQGGLLTEFLGCKLTETETAVLAEPMTRERDAQGRGVRAVGVVKQVTGRLTDPLGARVLIDSDGLPIQSCPSKAPAAWQPSTPSTRQRRSYGVSAGFGRAADRPLLLCRAAAPRRSRRSGITRILTQRHQADLAGQASHADLPHMGTVADPRGAQRSAGSAPRRAS